MIPAIEQQQRNWDAFKKWSNASVHNAKKRNIIYESEISVALNGMKKITTKKNRDFMYRDLADKVKINPVTLKTIMAVLRNRGAIKKISNRYWRLVEI